MANAALKGKMIALSEGADPRVVTAALTCQRDGVARIILVGDAAAITAEIAAQRGQIEGGITIEDPASSEHTERFAEEYFELRKHKGVTLDVAQRQAANPHIFAAMLVRLGFADGTIGGAATSTAEIVRTAIQVIGVAPDAKMISSFFLMLFFADHHPRQGALVFADCGLVIDPSAEEMAEIASASAQSLQSLTGQVPHVAMLSFSSKGSAAHARVSKVQQATDIARAANPDLLIDGELQFDAALLPQIAAAKAEGSPVAGAANVFVFPNLDAGNIGYKIAERIGGAIAIGPVLQGLARPANDLSRGCSAQDIIHMVAVTAAQADPHAPG
ncbi:MAG: phosphate acetyltransferase [Rhodobacteraceae bacterium]|nr:phosphate acetyltransferase [Paracoccaceae bacterium]